MIFDLHRGNAPTSMKDLKEGCSDEAQCVECDGQFHYRGDSRGSAERAGAGSGPCTAGARIGSVGAARPGPRAPAPGAAGPSQASPDDTTLKGCLIQGSGPTTFILENAKLSSDAADVK